MNFIKDVTVITAQGVKVYNVGDMIENEEVQTIEQRPLYFQGDPFEHYVGLSKNGEMLFSINCTVPCAVTYFPK